MSQEGIETARRCVEAFNRRDVDGFFALATPDFEWFPAMPVTVGVGPYTGRDGIERYMADIGEAWEEYRVLAEDFREVGDRVLVLGTIEGRGHSSHARVGASFGIVMDFRGERMCRIRAYLDPDEALASVDLKE